jgi:hypothetical protein
VTTTQLDPPKSQDDDFAGQDFDPRLKRDSHGHYFIFTIPACEGILLP